MDAFWQNLCEALVCVSPEFTEQASHRESLDRATTFLCAQVASLPRMLRVGTRLGLAAFRAEVLLTNFARFEHLSRERRVAAIARWADGPLPPGRQLFRALRNLAVLPYFESPAAPAVRTSKSAAPDATDVRAGVLIIGSGAGGSVTALELASRGHDVLVVEEGPAASAEPIDPGTTESMSALYRSRGMTPILGALPIAYVEGCCVGGSTELNSGFWHRPPAETLLRWKAQYDLDAASPDELRKHWEWAEDALGVRGHDGGLPISSELFARGAAAMDWSVAEVPRTGAEARLTQSRAGANTGWGMSRSLIPRAVDAGARLLTGYRVERLEMTGSRAHAAILEPRDATGQPIRVRAEHVFVCAGPTETPSLLRRSGIVRNVGDSLRIHPMLKVAARFNERLDGTNGRMPLLQVKEFWPEVVLGGAYFSPGHLAVVLANNWPDTHTRMHELERMACYYVGVRGTGRGHVRPSRVEKRRTHVSYELSQEDIWNLSRGIARLSSLLLKGGATEVLPAVAGLPAIRTEVDAIRWLDDRLDGRACSLTTVHAFSSCPIGERRDRCAADSFGQMHGLENVYINDASMIPDSPGVNPQGTIMTLARRNALHFCDAHPA